MSFYAQAALQQTMEYLAIDFIWSFPFPEHPQGSDMGTSPAPLQLRFRGDIHGDLGRKIDPACRKDQELLSPDTAIRKCCISL